MPIAIHSQNNKDIKLIKDKFGLLDIKSEFVIINDKDKFPAFCTSLILTGPVPENFTIPICVNDAIRMKKKILGVESGLISIIDSFSNLPVQKKYFEGDNSSFITLGSKLATIIGGAGPLKTQYSFNWEIPMNFIPDDFMASAFNTGNGCIEAVESKGLNEILGVIWPIFSSVKYPSGFENILSWISA